MDMETEDLDRRLPELRRAPREGPARWGTISQRSAEELAASDPFAVVEVRLPTPCTQKSFALALLEAFDQPGSTHMQTSAMWSEILYRSRIGRRRLVIIHGLENPSFAAEAHRYHPAYAVREALLFLVLRGMHFACTGPGSGHRFLLEDPQLRSRFVGAASPIEGTSA